MSSVLDKYGIKEVADVVFYNIATGSPVLYLDTLKVSTIEQTAEKTEAKGGKGNPPLISWDYGKEITVTLEDALFSAKSMAIMFGNGMVKTLKETAKLIMKTETFTCAEAGVGLGDSVYIGGKKTNRVNPKYFTENGAEIAVTALMEGVKYFCTYDVNVKNEGVIEISANSFPGVYRIVGDTYARSEITGEDECFQFIIEKAKVSAENTITLEAEGDPSVFNMNLRVLRPTDGVMMRLVKFDLEEDKPVPPPPPPDFTVTRFRKSADATEVYSNGDEINYADLTYWPSRTDRKALYIDINSNLDETQSITVTSSATDGLIPTYSMSASANATSIKSFQIKDTPEPGGEKDVTLTFTSDKSSETYSYTFKITGLQTL